MCRPLFGSMKAVEFNSVFFVTKFITDLESKGVYSEALIKKRCYFPKGGPCEFIDIQFEEKEVIDVGMMDLKTEYN